MEYFCEYGVKYLLFPECGHRCTEKHDRSEKSLALLPASENKGKGSKENPKWVLCPVRSAYLADLYRKPFVTCSGGNIAFCCPLPDRNVNRSENANCRSRKSQLHSPWQCYPHQNEKGIPFPNCLRAFRIRVEKQASQDSVCLSPPTGLLNTSKEGAFPSRINHILGNYCRADKLISLSGHQSSGDKDH